MKSLVAVHRLVLYEAVVVLALTPSLSLSRFRFPILTILAFHILPVRVPLIPNPIPLSIRPYPIHSPELDGSSNSESSGNLNPFSTSSAHSGSVPDENPGGDRCSSTGVDCLGDPMNPSSSSASSASGGAPFQMSLLQCIAL
jgi:hypothetical protein